MHLKTGSLSQQLQLRSTRTYPALCILFASRPYRCRLGVSFLLLMVDYRVFCGTVQQLYDLFI